MQNLHKTSQIDNEYTNIQARKKLEAKIVPKLNSPSK